MLRQAGALRKEIAHLDAKMQQAERLLKVRLCCMSRQCPTNTGLLGQSDSKHNLNADSDGCRCTRLQILKATSAVSLTCCVLYGFHASYQSMVAGLH